MVKRVMRICSQPGCNILVKSGYCDKHEQKVNISKIEYDKKRPKWHNAYNSKRWKQARISFLVAHPFCECDECKQNKRFLLATIVDHRIPHKGEPILFWDENNWQSMSKRCHNRKTAKEDGGFGNKKQSK